MKHGRIAGHVLSHWVMGAGGQNRGTTKEIYKAVASNAERSFNFTMNLTMASIIAGVGIAANSSVSAVATSAGSGRRAPGGAGSDSDRVGRRHTAGLNGRVHAD